MLDKDDNLQELIATDDMEGMDFDLDDHEGAKTRRATDLQPPRVEQQSIPEEDADAPNPEPQPKPRKKPKEGKGSDGKAPTTAAGPMTRAAEHDLEEDAHSQDEDDELGEASAQPAGVGDV